MTTDDRLNSLARSAVLVAIVSALTLVLMLVWQLLIARTFGASGELDAYWIAVAFPRAIAESFHFGLLILLFVLIFRRPEAGEGHDPWRASSAILNLTLLCTLAAILLLVGLAPELVRLMAPGFSPTEHALAASLMRWLALMLVPTAIAAAIGGIAVAHGELLPFTLSRAAMPALQVAVLTALAWALGIHALVWALWIGAAGALLVYIPWFRRVGFRYHFVLGLRDPDTLAVMKLQGILACVWLLINLNQVSDRYFASLLGVGSVSALEFAWRFEVPISQIVSLAVALPTFALLAQRASADRRDEFRATLAASARLLMLAVPPLLGFIVVLREPLARLWLMRGAFSAQSAHAVASLLPALSAVYFCRAFASILVFGLLMVGRARLLAGLLVVEVTLNTVLNLVLSHRFGLPGIALASAISMLAINAVLWMVLLADIGGVPIRRMLATVRPMAIAAVAAVAALDLGRRALEAFAPFGQGFGALLPLGAIGAAYLAVYVAICVGTGVIHLRAGAWPPLALRSLE